MNQRQKAGWITILSTAIILLAWGIWRSQPIDAEHNHTEHKTHVTQSELDTHNVTQKNGDK